MPAVSGSELESVSESGMSLGGRGGGGDMEPGLTTLLSSFSSILKQVVISLIQFSLSP